jgi:saccharopine dehydrogenase-like NADP-dependent oxidoreductase
MSPRKRKAGKPKVSTRKKKPTAKKVKPARAGTSKKRTAEAVSYGRRGLGARSGGQAGDTQGISARVGVDSESVEELLAEGQSFEAEVVNGVENAPDPDQGEVRTRQLPEDDVPEEYREQD